MADVVPNNEPQWNESLSNVVEPGSSRKLSGYAPGEIPSAGAFNWIVNFWAQWIRYLWARVQTYATLEELYAGLPDGGSGTLFEPQGAAGDHWGEQLNPSVDGTARPFFVSGNGPYLVVATSAGEPRVIARTTEEQGGGAATLFTLTRNTSATNVAVKCRGDYCVVASGARVDLFVISTGVRLWSYNHGAQVNDADIWGAYVFFAGVTSGGVRVGRITIASGTLADGYDPGATAVGVCALPDGSVVHYTSTATGYGGTHSMELLEADFATVRWTQASLTSTLGGKLVCDGHALYMGEAAGNVTCLSLADGSAVWNTTPTVASPAVRGISVDHGGVFVVAWDGATDRVRARLDKRNGGIVWKNDTEAIDYISVYADGSGTWWGEDGADGLSSAIRGNRPGSWYRVPGIAGAYNAYPWLTQPVGEE